MDATLLETSLLQCQGLYYAATGAWPLLSPGSFQRVTGPKHELWLVKTIGCLILAVAAPLLWAGAARRISPELVLLSAGAAAALAAVDVNYSLKRVIRPVYLADAALEGGFLVLWLVAALL